MKKFDKLDDDGAIVESYIVTDETERQDPEALVTMRFGGGDPKARQTAARMAKDSVFPDRDYLGVEHSDPDAMVTDADVYGFAKKGSYETEKMEKSPANVMRAAVASIERAAEERERAGGGDQPISSESAHGGSKVGEAREAPARKGK